MVNSIESMLDDSDKEVGFFDLPFVIQAYNELMLNSSKPWTDFQTLRKRFRKCSKENEVLKQDLTMSNDNITLLKK